MYHPEPSIDRNDNARDIRDIQVLVVDDNPADARLVAEAFDECRFPHHLYIVRDGLEAIAFITKIEQFENVPRPDLVIMDLQMPCIDGYGVLAVIKRTEEFRSIPVVMFSSSDRPEDLKKAYDLNANCYVVKPLDFNGYVGMILFARYILESGGDIAEIRAVAGAREVQQSWWCDGPEVAQRIPRPTHTACKVRHSGLETRSARSRLQDSARADRTGG
jgi:two-component system, chemotaxis family, response regulator Rcp1